MFNHELLYTRVSYILFKFLLRNKFRILRLGNLK